ncbi:peptidase A4 family-domain-containing protein [Fomitopsis serialis]|uniref:peptidase A4 family-domain-containing protein n=1 Tax=Fomitopsis serialis TaxID=139415 RepID=UPI0020089BA9|nr:peptidase A4 family-domain-containing protein [Neoantrodia serialis]KAH9931596.1 peptidase A4 family-domain-containing protein [Neoantrodia serialis]
MFASSFFSFVLLATAAVAAPKGRLADRLARRAEGSHMSRPMQLVEQPEELSNVSQVSYSSNWAGAVWEKSSGTFKSVTGTFVVPTPSTPSGGSGSYSASAWVGIDGDTCGNAILQTGVDFTVDGGSVSYDAWYEWYPDYAYDFSGISFSSGDTVKLTVTASSTTAGKAVIENVSTGKTVSKSITSSSALCEENAEWIVEDYEEGSSLVPFADFGTVTFTGASASTGSGSTGPSGATIIDIKQNNKVLTSVSTGSSSVTVKYV